MNTLSSKALQEAAAIITEAEKAIKGLSKELAEKKTRPFVTRLLDLNLLQGAIMIEEITEWGQIPVFTVRRSNPIRIRGGAIWGALWKVGTFARKGGAEIRARQNAKLLQMPILKKIKRRSKITLDHFKILIANPLCEYEETEEIRNEMNLQALLALEKKEFRPKRGRPKKFISLRT